GGVVDRIDEEAGGAAVGECALGDGVVEADGTVGVGGRGEDPAGGVGAEAALAGIGEAEGGDVQRRGIDVAGAGEQGGGGDVETVILIDIAEVDRRRFGGVVDRIDEEAGGAAVGECAVGDGVVEADGTGGVGAEAALAGIGEAEGGDVQRRGIDVAGAGEQGGGGDVETVILIDIAEV